MNAHYSLGDSDGAWWYYIPETTRFGRRRDDLVSVSSGSEVLEPGNRVGWWRSSVALDEVVLTTRRELPPTLGYVLGAFDENDARNYYPAELGPEQYASAHAAARAASGDAGAEFFASAYKRIVGKPRSVDLRVDLTDRIALGGGPPPALPAGSAWFVDLPVELRTRAEYGHLFPGVLRGLRARVTEALAALDGVSAHDHTTWTCYATVGGSLKELVKEGYLKPPAQEVTGPNLAAAAEKWEEVVESYVRTVLRLIAGGTCPRCGGTGKVPADPEPDEAKVAHLRRVFLRALPPRSGPSTKGLASRLADLAVRELSCQPPVDGGSVEGE